MPPFSAVLSDEHVPGALASRTHYFSNSTNGACAWAGASRLHGHGTCGSPPPSFCPPAGAALAPSVAELRVRRRYALMTFALLLLIAAVVFWYYAYPAEVTSEPSPRFKARIVCFNGKLDSDSSCSRTNFQLNGALRAKGGMTCGSPGQFSEIEWSFVQRHHDRDVYLFTRRFPSDTPAAHTTSKTVEFRDHRVVVFEDEAQVIVIEPPQK